MRIVIATQEDSFVIPENIERVRAIPGVEIVKIIVIDAKGSLVNKKSFFIKGFGLRQSAKMGMLLFGNKAADRVDALTGFARLPRKYSIKAVAEKYGIPYQVLDGKARKELYFAVKAENPDLVVSFSAPTVFGPKLLALPPKGCINLHCSHLPHYAGLMPSFWTLYNEEAYTGVTVHYMDDKIDNGMILGQAKVPIDRGMSMLDLIRRTKKRGGELMVEVIQQIQNDTTNPQPNPSDHGSYNSWPTLAQLKEFRKRGGRLA